MKKIMLAMILVVIVHISFADSLEQNWPKAGWLWYNKPTKTHLKRQPKEPVLRQVDTMSATAQMRRIRKATKEALDAAILYPTEEHTIEYLRLQKFLTDHASDFTNTWQKTLIDHPELDYEVSHPMQSVGRQVVLSEKSEKEKLAIHQLAKHFGLFFFYRGDNKLDQALAPSIESFAKTNGIALIPVVVDKHPLSSLPHTRIDRGQSKRLGVSYFPALILVNPKTGEHKALSYGFIAQDQLSERFLQVSTNFKRDW